jgi:hypothetical protein
MDQIIGSKSLMMMVKNTLLSNICLQYGYVGNKIDSEDLFSIQWSSLDFLTN